LVRMPPWKNWKRLNPSPFLPSERQAAQPPACAAISKKAENELEGFL